MDKGLTAPKWALIVWLKIPQMPQNLSDQFVFPSSKVWDFNEKRLHWSSVVSVTKKRVLRRKSGSEGGLHVIQSVSRYRQSL